MDNLFAAFHGSSFERGELELFLLSHFGRSGKLTPRAVVYPSHRDRYVLKLCYDDDANLVKIVKGPLCTDDILQNLIARIKNELIDVHTMTVHRTICFASAPVNGYFRYKNMFQILPLADDDPKPANLVDDHPFIVEYTYKDSTNSLISAYRKMTKKREIDLLLSGILRFQTYMHGRSQRHWVINENPSRVSQYLDVGYTCPSLSKTGGFSSTRGVNPLERKGIDECHVLAGRVYRETAMSVPVEFEELLDIFFYQDNKNREKFIRSCFWWQCAHREVSDSVAFMNLINAIESLMPEHKGGGRCQACGKEMEGPTKRFEEFVDKWAKGKMPKKTMNELYRIRSDLVHGRTVFWTDWKGWHDDVVERERDNAGRVWQLVGNVLINWLRSQALAGSLGAGGHL